MKYSRFTIAFWCFFLILNAIHAQGVQGIRTERWAGISGVHLNPAVSNVYPKKWDVQLVGANLYGATDYLFLKNTNLFDILRHPEDIRAVSDTLGEAAQPAHPILFDFPLQQKNWYGVLDARMDGPGFAFRFGDRHTLGCFSAVRINTSGYRVPGTLGYKYLDEVPWQTTQPGGAFHINGMAWAEFGGHYSYRSPDLGENSWGFGVNAKMIRVIQAGYARTNSKFDYIRNNRDSITLTTGDWDIGFTNDIASSTDPMQAKPHFNGMGFALDLGFNYLIADTEADVPEDYKWEFGLAITDLGYALVNRNAEAHHIQFQDSVKISLDGLNQVENVDQVIKTMSVLYLSDSLASYAASSFSMQMPARINAHADYKIRPNIYAHASLQQRLPMSSNTLRSPNVLAITPRFESQWFSAFVPVSVTDWQHLRIGAAARFGVLTVGSDHLASLVGQSKWQGTDLYFMLKINAFSLKFKDRGLSRKDRTWRRVGCYDL